MDVIGQLTRDLQERFNLFGVDRDGLPKRTRVTPENLAALLSALEAQTDAIREKRDGGANWLDMLDPTGAVMTGGRTPEELDLALLQWRGRLGAYQDAVKAAIPGDRQGVLWTVTAPLLLGLYGGQASTLPRQTLDAVTPAILAHALDVEDAWKAERLRLLWEDLKDNAKDLADDASGLITAIAVAGGVVGGVLLMSWLRSLWK